MAPLGTSLFQLWKDREFANQHKVSLNQKYEDNVAKQARKLTSEEKAPKFINEPLPGPTHVICAICQYQFTTGYYQHISSERH